MSEAFNLTTYYAKRIIGDSAAASETSALLLTGNGVTGDTWILHRDNRDTASKLYGIKYAYDNSGHDKIEYYGQGTGDNATAWIQLDTGDASFNNILGKIYVNAADPSSGTSYYLTFTGSSTAGHLDILNKGTVRAYLGGTKDYLCIGNSSKGGGVTIYGSTNYTDIVTSASSSNKTVTFPNVSGWIAVGGNGSSTGAGDTDTPVYLKTDGTLAAITSYDGNAASATKLQNARNLWGNSFDGTADISGNFVMKNTSSRYHRFTVKQHGTDNTVGEMYYDSGNVTNVTSGRWSWEEWSPNSTNNTGTTGFYEVYRLPVVNTGLTANASYNILTSKDLSFSITGNAATATRLEAPDSRSTNEPPSTLMGWGRGITTAFKLRSTVGTPNGSGNYGIILNLTPWNDNSGSRPKLLWIDDSSMSIRHSTSDSAWSSWSQFVTNSGTWGISITGSSATLGCARVTKSANEHPGKNIVRMQEFSSTSANLPSSHFYYILEAQGDDPAYSIQLALGETTSALYYRAIQNNTYGNWLRIIDNTNWYKYIFANKNISRSTLTVYDSTWAVTSGTDVFGLSFKDTGLTYTPSGGSATASSDTGDWRMWLTCAATSNTVLLNMRIDGQMEANTFKSYSTIHAGSYIYTSSYLQANTHVYLDTGHVYMKYNNTWYSVLHNHGNGNISVESASGGLYMAYQNTTLVNWMNGRMELRDGCLSLFPNNTNYREGLRIHSTSNWSDITLCGNDNTGNTGTSANSWFIGNNNGNFYISRNGSPGSTAYIGCVGNVWKVYGNQTNSKSKQQSILHIFGPTYGNTAADLISGTAGLMSWGDGGPQITFDTSATPGGGQAGALLFTDHDTCATGASFHFLSNQTDWNVISKRFHARTSISIGSDLPNTSYNFVLNGTANHTTGYWYINGGAGGIINGAATNGGINSIRVGDDVWLGDCNAGGIMGMKSTGTNCGFYFYNSSSTQIGLLYCNSTNYIYSNRVFYIPNTGSSWIDGQRYQRAAINIHTINNTGSYFPWVNQINSGSGRWFSFGLLNASLYWISSATSRTDNGYDYGMQWIGNTGHLYATAVHSAVWNDYAECRQANINEPGRIVLEQLDGIMILANERLLPGCRVISDTYGMLIGETPEAKTPIGVSGRVLVYPYLDRSKYELGAAVCSAPNGTVDIMTREEIREYPERIIGTVSEIPHYETWMAGGKGTADALGEGTIPILVNGRIWIYVR